MDFKRGVGSKEALDIGLSKEEIIMMELDDVSHECYHLYEILEFAGINIDGSILSKFRWDSVSERNGIHYKLKMYAYCIGTYGKIRPIPKGSIYLDPKNDHYRRDFSYEHQIFSLGVILDLWKEFLDILKSYENELRKR